MKPITGPQRETRAADESSLRFALIGYGSSRWNAGRPGECDLGWTSGGLLSAYGRSSRLSPPRYRVGHHDSDAGYGFHGLWVNLEPWFGKLDLEAIANRARLSLSHT